MKILRKLLIGALGCLPIFDQAAASSQCQSAIEVTRGNENRVVADATRIRRVIEPSFFGFNLEWLEFQHELWDSKAQRVLPGVISIFRDFPGAVYRFPGGTNSNHLNWADTVGPVVARPNRKQVSWRDPLKAEFGLDEYLRFVKNVNGQAWYVANLFGSLDSPEEKEQLVASAEQLTAYIKKREKEGLPPILRWELGNELDRGEHKWPPEKLANAAQQVATAIQINSPEAKFVHLQQEYPAQASKGFSANRYNKELRSRLALLNPEFAMHFYYDGPPDGPPVSYFLRQLCQVVDNAKAEGAAGVVWVTEHGRVPKGFWSSTPKELWPATANLEAAISVADMLIGLTQVPEAKGAITHSLVASSSPWPLVHRRKNGVVDPSVPLLGMKLLRQSLLPNALHADQISATSGKNGANYGVRSAVLADSFREKFSLWAINRTNSSQFLDFHLKNAKGDIRYQRGESVSNNQANINNYFLPGQISVVINAVNVTKNGDYLWRVELPANSIVALSFASVK